MAGETVKGPGRIDTPMVCWTEPSDPSDPPDDDRGVHDRCGLRRRVGRAVGGSLPGASGPVVVTDTLTGVAEAVVAASATQPAPASNGSQTARLAASAAGRRRRREVDVSVLGTPLLSPG